MDGLASGGIGDSAALLGAIEDTGAFPGRSHGG